MALRLSVSAQGDLYDIALSGLDLFGTAQTRRYEDGLIDCFARLERFPLMGAEHTEYEPPVRIHPYEVHIIIYRIIGDDVLVVRVCHAREDWTRLV